MVFRAKDAAPGTPGVVAKGGARVAPEVKLAREAIASFVDQNAGKLAKWLDLIELEHGPKAAFECLTTLIEYRVPKLARIEHRGDGDGPVEIVVRWDEG